LTKTVKHELSIDNMEQKLNDLNPARTASLLPRAGTVIQDVACKHEVPELDIKKKIDLSLSR